jgi:hypothetical protein
MLQIDSNFSKIIDDDGNLPLNLAVDCFQRTLNNDDKELLLKLIVHTDLK